MVEPNFFKAWLNWNRVASVDRFPPGTLKPTSLQAELVKQFGFSKTGLTKTYAYVFVDEMEFGHKN